MHTADPFEQRLERSPRTWIVTGAAGFIGSNLVETLLSLGQRVVGVDNFATGHRHNLDDVLARVAAPQRFELVEMDVNDGAMREVCRGADYVLHQAALGSVPLSIDDPLAAHRANVDGFINTLVAAHQTGVRRFVYASSSAVYGDSPRPRQIEGELGRALSPYAVTKRIDELYARVFEQCYGVESVGLRYFNVFGRRQDPAGAYAAVIPRWVATLLSRQRCTVFGDGQATRDFCHVSNVVRANLLAAAHAPSTATGREYNIACGTSTSVNRLYGLIRDGLAHRHPELAGVQPIYAAPRPGDILHSVADISAARRHLSYDVRCDVASGMARTLDWYEGAFAGSTAAAAGPGAASAVTR